MQDNYLTMLSPSEYWSQSEQHFVQKMYVSFTLFASAALDYAVGLQLREEEKMNWSTACYYYSMVHAGRCMTFIALGDFPTQHSDLITLFGSTNSSDRSKIDWLRKFTNSIASTENRPAIDSLSIIIKYFSEECHVIDAASFITHFGAALNQSKKLRNDSNYESLLIAHEFNHERVTNDFKRLSETLSGLAGRCLKGTASCFSNFLRYDGSIEERRTEFQYFINKYVEDRILEPVRKRCGNKYELLLKEKIAVLLTTDIPHTPEVEKNCVNMEKSVSRDIFDQKSELMMAFRERISSLESLLRSSED